MKNESKLIARFVAGVGAVAYLYFGARTVGSDIKAMTTEFLPPPDIVLSNGQVAIPGSVKTTPFVKSTAEDDASLFFLNATEPPSLEEFLSKFTCSGCSKACLLTSPTCINGQGKNEQAIVIYQQMYPQMEI